MSALNGMNNTSPWMPQTGVGGKGRRHVWMQSDESASLPDMHFGSLLADGEEAQLFWQDGQMNSSQGEDLFWNQAGGQAVGARSYPSGKNRAPNSSTAWQAEDPESVWPVCTACTFRNDPNATECAMCGLANPDADSTYGSSSAGGSDADADRRSNISTGSSPDRLATTVDRAGWEDPDEEPPGNWEEEGLEGKSEENGWEVAGPKHLKGLKPVVLEEGSFGANLAILLSEQNGEPMNAAKLPAAYQQRFETKIPLVPGQKLKQLLMHETDKGVCSLEERKAGYPPTPVLFVRLLDSRSGLKDGEFTGVSGYMFVCTNETEHVCLSQHMLMASAKELRSLWRDIGPTTKLFLCNYDSGTVHGPWLPLGEPALSSSSSVWHNRFPAQLRVRSDSDFPTRSVPAHALSWGRQRIPGGVLAPRKIEELCQGGVGSSGHVVRSPPGASYRCKWCGKEGGQPDSHWHQACDRHPDNRADVPNHKAVRAVPPRTPPFRR